MRTTRDEHGNVVTRYSDLMGDDDNFGMYDSEGYNCNDAGRRPGESDDAFFNRTNQHPGDFDADVFRCGIRQNNAKSNGFFGGVADLFSSNDSKPTNVTRPAPGMKLSDEERRKLVKEYQKQRTAGTGINADKLNDAVNMTVLIAGLAFEAIGAIASLFSKTKK